MLTTHFQTSSRRQISFDHADEQAHQQFPPARADWRENALVSSKVYGTQALVELFAFDGQG
jgi:hypothetical protein